MNSRHFLYLCVVLTILLSGMVTPLFQPAAAVAASPDTPSNVSPLDGATDVSLTPTLQSSAFSDHDWFDRHVASQWQIAAAGSHGTNPDGSYSSTVFDSDTDRSNLISIAVPSGILNYSNTYYWHVRYRDNSRARAWSGWSPETSFATQRAPLTFADPNLEAAIRGAIGKPTGTIYQSDLDTLVTLNASNRGITKLSGLERCTSLKKLDLSRNQVGDISPLASLSSLTYLSLHTNQISDISPLSGLANLTDLYLHANQISNISPLTKLTSLTDLSLYINQIRDISPLAGLTDLTKLFLGYNQISNISPLSGLANLTHLYLHDNQISDLKPLVDNQGIASGDTVSLNTNPLSSVSVDVYIPALEVRGVEVYWDGSDTLPLDRPVNVSPADGAAAVSPTPTLQSSVFSDSGDGSAHEASQWQITSVAGDYLSTVFDSGRDTTHLTSIVAPALNCSTVYYWRVRYQDNRGVWSDWSAETSFTSSAQDAGDGEGDGDSSSDGDGNGDEGTSPATPNKGGPPFWVWIIVGVGAAAFVATGILIWRRMAKKPAATA